MKSATREFTSPNVTPTATPTPTPDPLPSSQFKVEEFSSPVGYLNQPPEAQRQYSSSPKAALSNSFHSAKKEFLVDAKGWQFIPTEVDELYHGDVPDLYACLNVPRFCSSTELIPAYRKLITQHLPILSTFYNSEAKYLELIGFLCWTLRDLTEGEMRTYVVPYNDFGEVLMVYWDQCLGTGGFGFDVAVEDAGNEEDEEEEEEGGGREAKVIERSFESILLAYLILNNPQYRKRYDLDLALLMSSISNSQILNRFSVTNKSPAPESTYTIIRKSASSFPPDVLSLKGPFDLAYKAQVKNVGVWINNRNRKRAEEAKNWMLQQFRANDQAHKPFDEETEELRWEYNFTAVESRKEGFELVRRERREKRTGWFGAAEKIASSCLEVVQRNPLFAIERGWWQGPSVEVDLMLPGYQAFVPRSPGSAVQHDHDWAKAWREDLWWEEEFGAEVLELGIRFW